MAQNKKEMIVRAAIEVFRDKGIEKTKISDIVQVAGVAQGTFYLYFPSKLSLMPAIAEVMVAKTMEILRSTVSEKASFSDQMQQFVEAIFSINEEYHEIQALIYSGLASTEHLKEWEAVYEPIYVWLSEKLDKAKDSGEIRNSIRSAHTAKLIIGLVESAAEQIYLYDSQAENMADTQKREVKEFLKHALQMD
ncbi:TetR family transcriptional regulator [Sporosarcina sp. NCCP-2222]|uniref:TetR family transcriptional regulator n=1 Tax=Sporosarcina sp. NCCP-2222 TaxID=2935073 RepID=UPI00208C895C|nr:TetR family transcriptional regulator [Sporosarcina sp. NCCP-2222]GKV54737.1 TetR family transcriptional regulator [Sporosarcina sp. NCCP-2222]